MEQIPRDRFVAHGGALPDSLRKSLAAYYTPQGVADTLADWAIRSPTDAVLEPSAGGGSLVDAALKRLSSLRSVEVQTRVLACDIDPGTVGRLQEKYRGEVELRAGDFLALKVTSTGLFDVVLANPPFTRNHALTTDRRRALREQFSTTGAAGLWVAFLTHAVSFLRPGGRLVSIVPGAALFANYAAEFAARLAGQFARVQILALRNQPTWSAAADERGAVLVAEGFNEARTGSKPVIGGYWGETRAPASSSGGAFSDLLASSTTLGQMSTISIGVVTGRNRLFLMNEAERLSHGLRSEDVTPVASRARHVQGLAMSVHHLETLARSGEKTLLLSPREISPNLEKYLSVLSELERESISWLRKRKVWWEVEMGSDPDAIFTYMNHLGPRMTLTSGQLTCTNTLHRVKFGADVSKSDRIAAAISMISSFGQLASERTGRVYGGGVLKFELSDARRLPILRPRSTVPIEAIESLDKLLRLGKGNDARRLADQLLLQPLLGVSWEAGARDLAAQLVAERAERLRSKMAPDES